MLTWRAVPVCDANVRKNKTERRGAAHHWQLDFLRQVFFGASGVLQKVDVALFIGCSSAE
jgi:hypothetical protein